MVVEYKALHYPSLVRAQSRSRGCTFLCAQSRERRVNLNAITVTVSTCQLLYLTLLPCFLQYCNSRFSKVYKSTIRDTFLDIPPTLSTDAKRYQHRRHDAIPNIGVFAPLFLHYRILTRIHHRTPILHRERHGNVEATESPQHSLGNTVQGPRQPSS